MKRIRGIGTVVVASLAVGAASADTVVIAPHMLLRDGSLAEGRAVVIGDDGIIQQVVEVASLDQADHTVIRFDRGVISPGLIDVNASLGRRISAGERARVIDDEARAVEAVDMTSPEFVRAQRAGVTAALIWPGFQNIVPGQGAVIHTWSPTTSPDVLNDQAGLFIVLSSSTYSEDREPSSRAGALNVLRSAMEEAEAKKSGALHAALGGDLPLFVVCEEAQDVTWALATFGRRGVTPTIVHTVDALEIAAHAAEANATVVVGPYSFSADEETLSGAGELAEAGAAVALSGDVGVGDPDRLRIGAALAVAHGLDPNVARHALTRGAAQVAGIAHLTGSIEPGMLADLVVFSGDPLRLDSRVIAVWVRGERVFSAESHQVDHETVIGATDE